MIVIGDIHGNYKTLMALVAKFPKDQQIVLVGDLIDRGPMSCQVVQWAIDNNIESVQGNHEVMMITNHRNFNASWMYNGGEQTLDSYKDKDGNIDEGTFITHQEWMNDLPLVLAFPDVKNEDGRYLVVSHSSCGAVWDWSHKRKEEQASLYEGVVLWGRNAPKDAPEIYNVFGHTPQENGPRIKQPFANVDTGCFYKEPGYGKLTGLQFPEMIVYEQENIDE